jgi:hypothetical protein
MSCQGHAFGVTPLSASTPTCAFMPKYQSLPFLVDDISGSRAPALRPGLRVMRLDQPNQPNPRHNRLHLGQERLRRVTFFFIVWLRRGRAGCFGIGGAPSSSGPVYPNPPKAPGSSDVS